MPTPSPIIEPRIGATVPIVTWVAMSNSTEPAMATPKIATPIGRTAASSVRKRMKRMMRPATMPMRSAKSLLPAFWMSVTDPPNSTWTPVASTGFAAAVRSLNASTGRSEYVPS